MFFVIQSMEKNKELEYWIADTLIERPYAFSVNERLFYLYPVTIGKSYLLMRNIDSLGLNKQNLQQYPSLEILKACKHHRDTVLRILAYHTLEGKKQILNHSLVESRIKYFDENISDDDLAQLLTIVLNDDKTAQFTKYLGIDQENIYKSRISKLKSETTTTVSLCGKSVYGTLIDFACERYGWSYDYVIWGISYANLKMLMSDSISTHYLSKDEMRKLHIPKDRTVVSADNKENLERMKKYFKD